MEKELILKHLFKKEVSESFDFLNELHFEYTNFESFEPQNLQPAFERKMEFFNPILNGEATTFLDFSGINTKEITLLMYEEVLKSFANQECIIPGCWSYKDVENKNLTPEEEEQYKINDIFFWSGKHLVDFLKDNISKEEISENRSFNQFKIGKKRFGIGAKITRILSAIAENFRFHYIKNNLVGNLLTEIKTSKLYLSTHPITGYLAGIISKSCLSPYGANSHGGVLYNGYKNTALLINEDLNWRAFIIFDFEKKYFSVLAGYPKEDYALQCFIKIYFENLGYKYIEGVYFSFPEYFDTSNPLTGERVLGDRNEDAFYTYKSNERITSTSEWSTDTIAEVFYNEWDDIKSLDPDMESSNTVWCEYEEDYVYIDDTYWSDFLDSYISRNGEEYFYNHNAELVKEVLQTVLKGVVPEDWDGFDFYLSEISSFLLGGDEFMLDRFFERIVQENMELGDESHIKGVELGREFFDRAYEIDVR